TLPSTPLAAWLGFTSLPAAFFLLLIAVVGAYLLLVEMFKRRLDPPEPANRLCRLSKAAGV
ncbi:MAG TPA: hypothetical protein VE715_07155, partial [Blastocatellia bacterium]|nr:hypothetical protein [Blastocatellia bacterium]